MFLFKSCWLCLTLFFFLLGTLPFYPSLPAIEAEHEDTTLDTISELQEPQAPRGVIRPLGRTQSSPLPLGHPLLEGPPPIIAPPPPPTVAEEPPQQLSSLEQKRAELEIVREHANEARR